MGSVYRNTFRIQGVYHTPDRKPDHDQKLSPRQRGKKQKKKAKYKNKGEGETGLIIDFFA